jgi:hypothetical protein
MTERLSYLQVDRWYAAGDPRAERLRADPVWAAHLGSLTPEEGVPDWALQLERRRPARWVLLPLGLAAATLLALLAARDPYVGLKGEPALLVHRQVPGGSEVWDGQGALRAGDAIQLEVRGVSAPWYAVVHLDPDEPPTVLASGTTPGLLPRAWVFDDAARGSRVVLLAAEGDPAGLDPGALLGLPVLAEVELR